MDELFAFVVIAAIIAFGGWAVGRDYAIEEIHQELVKSGHAKYVTTAEGKSKWQLKTVEEIKKEEPANQE